MKLGLHSFSYHLAAGLWDYAPVANEPMSATHFLRKAAELNLDGVFFCDPRHFESLEYAAATALREKAELLGLQVEIGMTGTNPEVLQDLVRTAHVLGSPTVRASVDRPRARSAEGMRQVLTAVMGELQEVAPLCERYGLALALENTPHLTAEELLSLLEMAGGDWLRVCFDTGNPLVTLEDPVESAAALAPFLVSAHLKDYQVAAGRDGFALLGCALGEGVVDLVSIVDLLSARAPAANLYVETAAGKQHVPALEEAYLSHLPQTPASALGRTLRLVRDRSVAHLPQTAQERGADEDEVLAEEDEQVVRSVRWAQRTLGRPEAEDLKPGE
jgi:sugar phosphate isomerase/epimerase